MYGQHSLASVMMPTLLKLDTAKRHMPTGGVRLPIMISSVMTTPRLMRSSPYCIAIGKEDRDRDEEDRVALQEAAEDQDR